MDRPKLKAENRTIVGRKVKTLRRDGILPANVYGKEITSLALQVPVKEFMVVYNKVGETGLVDLEANGTVKPILITNVQMHPVYDTPLHADFRQVDLKEKIQAAIPVEVEGESPAVKSGIGILVQQLQEVEVEALPTDLPEKFVVDVSSLENVDEGITVAELKVDRAKVTVLSEAEQVVVKVEPLAAEEVEPVAETPVEGEAGVPVPEGETPTEGESSEEQPVKEEKSEE